MAGVNEVKVALITGGADGMGLAVAKALAADKSAQWKIHILDIKEEQGNKAVATLGGAEHAVFHKVDITNYESLAAAFKSAFLDGGRKRLDVVFANAGIFEMSKYYDNISETDEPPPAPDYIAVDVNVKGTINTVHLARHYISRSPDKGSIVITASCSSFWPTYWAPLYTTSKFAILGFLRSIAGHFKTADNIRVNALCPGAMRTAIVPAEAWDPFPEDVFTPLDSIADVALQLAGLKSDGKGSFVDSKGVEIPAGAYGQAVIANGKNFYLQEEPEYCDEAMRQTIQSTRVDKH